MVNALNSGCQLQALIAPAGLGKSMVLQRLVESLPQFRHWFYQFTLPCSTAEFYRLAIEQFVGENNPDLRDNELLESFAALVSNSFNAAGGTLLILDEAQEYLSRALLAELVQILELCGESVRIILCGQPKLLEVLREAEAVPKALDLWQTLSPLTVDESVRYITERAHLEGYSNPIFPVETLLEIARDGGGVPFVINNLCWAKLSQHRREDRRLAWRDVKLAQSPSMSMPVQRSEPSGTMSGVQDASAHSQDRTPSARVADSVEALLGDVVSWTGTAGELLAALSIPSGVRELLECLSSERGELLQHGISVDVRHRDGLPSLISLRRLTADQNPDHHGEPSCEDPAEDAAQISRIPPQAASSTQRFRWRRLAVWTLGLGTTVAVVAGVMRTAETRMLRANQVTASPTTTVAQTSGGSRPVFSRVDAPASPVNLAEPHGDDPRVSKPRPDRERLRQAALTRDPALQYEAALEMERIDKVEAYKWLVISHAAGYEQSLGEIRRLTPQLSAREIGRVRHEVARAYLSGQGSPVDLVQAYRWLALAKASDVSVDDELRSLSRRMSAQQIANASKDAQNWLGHGVPERATTPSHFAKPIQR